MGSMIDINDTLEITTEQGFPIDVFDLERHRRDPITIDDVEGRVFEFHGKVNPRIFQLDPVRVFFYHNIPNAAGETKWLAWGEVVILSLKIEKNPDVIHGAKVNESDPRQWVTSGTYRILKIYDPRYQKMFTEHETPEGFNYFDGDSRSAATHQKPGMESH